VSPAKQKHTEHTCGDDHAADRQRQTAFMNRMPVVSAAFGCSALPFKEKGGRRKWSISLRSPMIPDFPFDLRLFVPGTRSKRVGIAA
jgi:hypothetical protein